MNILMCILTNITTDLKYIYMSMPIPIAMNIPMKRVLTGMKNMTYMEQMLNIITDHTIMITLSMRGNLMTMSTNDFNE